MDVNVISHSICGHLLGILRDKSSSSLSFRRSISSISKILFIEASRDVRTMTYRVETPFESTVAVRLERGVVLVPILRAGLSMLDGVWSIFPEAVVEHIGIYRDDESLKPIPYYSSLDENLTDSFVFVLDPMLATGGTMRYALEEIARFKPESIDILTIVAAPEGLENVSVAADKLEDIRINLWTAAVDRCLNDDGFILPGLGDAGDRTFGTI